VSDKSDEANSLKPSGEPGLQIGLPPVEAAMKKAGALVTPDLARPSATFAIQVEITKKDKAAKSMRKTKRTTAFVHLCFWDLDK